MDLVRAGAFIFLTLLPGLVTLRICKQSGMNFILALPVSCSISYVTGNYVELTTLPSASAKYWLIIGALMAAATVQAVRGQPGRLHVQRKAAFEFLPSFVAGAVLLVIWYDAATFAGQLLPNHDAMYHSYVIRNIIDTQSMQIREALRLFPVGSGSAADFYPIGLHSVLAQSVSITGVSINGAMNLVTIVLGVACFPLAATMWCRELLGRSPLVSIGSPIAALLFGATFPLSPLSWGGMPAIVAMTVAPVAAVSIYRLIKNPSRSGVLLNSLVITGVFSIHPTEVLTTFGLSLLLLIVHRDFDYRRVIRVGFQLGVISLLALAPILPATLGGATERNLIYQEQIDPVVSLGQSLLFAFPGYVLPTATVIVLSTIVFSNDRRTKPIAVAFFLTVLLTVAAARFPTHELIVLITKPWYGQVLRINYNIVYFAIPLVVIGFNALRRELRRVPIQFLAVAVFLPLTVIGIDQSLRSIDRLLNSWYDELIPTDKDSIAAFHWMASRLQDDEYVLTDLDGIDGSTWMYALSGARPVMYGAIASDDRDSLRQTKISILSLIGDLQSRPDLLMKLKEERIRYFYFDTRTNAVSPSHTVELTDAIRDQSLELVFWQDNAYVFEFIE